MGTIWGDTAKDTFLLGPYNFVASLITVSTSKALLTYAGPQAYGSTLGNLKIAGITLLGCIIAGMFVALGQKLFKIEDGEKTNDAFGVTLMTMLLCLCATLMFVGRALLMLVGLLDRHNPPPLYLDWMFRSIELFW